MGEGIALYIMAGGKSSRFGSDKARALHQGKTLLEHVAEALREAATSITVVAQEADQYADLGFLTIADREPHLGPMGGLQSALSHHQAQTQVLPQESGWCAVVSCDVVGLRVAWLQELLAHRDSDHKAIAFGTAPWDPLFALYHVDLLPEIEARLTAGQGSLWRMLEDVGALALPHPKDWGVARSVNTREALVGL